MAALRGATTPARTLGLVPTMGALHEGHLSLIRQARAECDQVLVSLFVNPTQFDEQDDLSAYPRDEQRDMAMAQEAGADLLFAPRADEMYPAGHRTSVHVDGLTERWEGAHRGSSHFDGVATVVVKLLNMAAPDVAYFGQKDAQQAVVIRTVVRDLNLPVRICVCPTVRDPDGLALSSRNARLSPAERRRGLALHRALVEAERRVAAGESDVTALLSGARATMADLGAPPEYLALVDRDTFEPLGALTPRALLTVAARVGPIRLIDNTLISAAAPLN